METNKIDKKIKEKFANRTFKPSTSAWERLSLQLDEQPKTKKFGLFFYTGIAASILLLVTISIQIFNNDSGVLIQKEEIVISPIDKKQFDMKIDDQINQISFSEILVKNEVLELKKEIINLPVIKNKNSVSKPDKFYKKNLSINQIVGNKDDVISNEIKKSKEILNHKILKQDPNSSIKINADDLLYAVTHSSKEVKAYYAKYNINREEVLKTIKSELKKSNLKINPKTILAEVERSIDDDFFENNFMKGLKKRVSDIAVAIASRNN